MATHFSGMAPIPDTQLECHSLYFKYYRENSLPQNTFSLCVFQYSFSVYSLVNSYAYLPALHAGLQK